MLPRLARALSRLPPDAARLGPQPAGALERRILRTSSWENLSIKIAHILSEFPSRSLRQRVIHENTFKYLPLYVSGWSCKIHLSGNATYQDLGKDDAAI